MIDQLQRLGDQRVHIHGLALMIVLAEHAAYFVDDVTGAMPLVEHSLQGETRLFDIGRLLCKPAQGRAGVGNDCCERLLDLMRDRRRKLARGRGAIHVGKLVGALQRLGLGDPAQPVFVQQSQDEDGLKQQRDHRR